MEEKIKVGIVGLSFGMEFVPIYLSHPNIKGLVVADINESLLEIVRDKYGFTPDNSYTDVKQMLDDPSIDAIHIVTPPSSHAELSINVLNSGKHCGCTIPMGMSIPDLYAIIEARKRNGKNYMFLETSVFSREYYYVKDLLEKGAFGRIQYMSCAHYQDMNGWPNYWDGFPPLMHPTHAVGPCMMLAGKYPEKVYCKGSGRISEQMAKQYNSPFAFESALITLEDSDMTVQIERFLYGVARSYSECFRVYGENMSFEWQQLEHESPAIYTRTGSIQTEMTYLEGDPNRFNRGGEIIEERIVIPDYANRLPPEIAAFTCETVYNDENTHLSFRQGGGHGGSHPHMIHEFVRSIVEERTPLVDDILGAYWTGAGICAHQSALNGGSVVNIPEFKLLK